MHKPQVEDLQFLIHQLKKENLDLRSENQLLKVKIRKLHDEVNRKNRQLDGLLDPRKNTNVSKVISRQGAALIIKLKDENFDLQKKLAEKDLLAKKLQSDIETTKLYVNERIKFIPPNIKLFETQEAIQRVVDLNNGSNYKAFNAFSKRRSKSVNEKKSSDRRNMSPAAKESMSAIELQMQKNYIELLNSNLQKIKQCGSIQNNKMNPSCNSVNSNKSDTPHEEIQQLQGYLLNVLNEVDSLKTTIHQMQNEQNKTPFVMNEKNSNINKLVSNIATKKIDEALKSDKIKTSETETEPVSTDLGSSKCSTCDYTGESDCNETTDGSTTTKSSRKGQPSIRRNSKSISIQTKRSFCSKTFTPADSKSVVHTEKGRQTSTDENDVDVEYID